MKRKDRIKELREKDPVALLKEVKDWRQKIFQTKLENPLKGEKDIHKVRKMKKELAQILTILNEKIDEQERNTPQNS
ncbi:50S ribosomal protein L29 [Candidatus Berkelbacteria bacterium]|nr:50S ribosomal protein L29 [Candidatus Berkelbacteria bacterium]MBI4029744.1 50S ribosomal protein L29 [Candidatus Berkelbacteria bacterium]